MSHIIELMWGEVSTPWYIPNHIYNTYIYCTFTDIPNNKYL